MLMLTPTHSILNSKSINHTRISGVYSQINTCNANTL